MILRTVLAATALCLATPTQAQDDPDAMEAAVAQLEHVIGEWEVVTTFIRPDGSVAGEVPGTYTFGWVHEGAVVSGTSAMPAFGQTTGLLFYVRPGTEEIEMASVGPDGALWVMTGDAASEVRETPVVTMPDGSTLKLRFTRFNVTEDRFESRMDRSDDGGETWYQGNHQLFVRRNGSTPLSEAVQISDGEQALRQSLVVDAPLAEAWAMFTTTEGVEKWMAPVAAVDLRSGGSIRTNYDPCAALGEDGTITLNIVNFVPEQFLILRADLSAQQGAAWLSEAMLERAPHMSNLITLEDAGEGGTRITTWGLGYGTGEDWAQMVGFFTAGNEWSFGQLRRALAGEDLYPDCEG